jgi:hypothetical protein
VDLGELSNQNPHVHDRNDLCMQFLAMSCNEQVTKDGWNGPVIEDGWNGHAPKDGWNGTSFLLCDAQGGSKQRAYALVSNVGCH